MTEDATALLRPRTTRDVERYVARGGVYALVIYFTGAGLTYCSQLVVARLIGAASYGLYAYVLAWMTVLAYVSALGFDVSLLRFVPAYRARDAWDLARSVIRYAERWAAAAGSTIAVLLAMGVALNMHGLKSELAGTFLTAAPLIPILALLWIRCAVVRTFGGVVGALVPDRLVRDGLLIVLLGAAAAIWPSPISAAEAMVATVTTATAGLCVVSVAKRRLAPTALLRAPYIKAERAWIRTAAPLVALGTLEAVMNRTGVVFLGWSGLVKEAGIYALAFNVAFLVVLPRTAVNALFAPAISDLHSRGDRAGLKELIGKAAGWSFLGALCLAIPLCLGAGRIMALLGHDFIQGVAAVRLLVAGQVIAALCGSQLHVMTMTGHERGAALLIALSALANAALTALLVQPLGLMGAALATAAASIFWNGIMAIFIWRCLRLPPGPVAICSALRSG